MEINVLLCDDDKAFLQKLHEALTSLSQSEKVSVNIRICSHPASLTDRALSQFQIMFLDIDMEERSGMEIARRVRELRLDTTIIFVTNYPQFSLEGYEVRAFRYLLKQGWEEKLPGYYHAALNELPQADKALRFSVKAETFAVPYREIIYLESSQRLIYLYTVKPLRAGDHFYGKMEELAKELEPEGFLRIQRSYLVNMAHIKKLNYDLVVLSNGKELTVSQKRYAEMKIQYLEWKNKQWRAAQ